MYVGDFFFYMCFCFLFFVLEFERDFCVFFVEDVFLCVVYMELFEEEWFVGDVYFVDDVVEFL